MKFLFFIFHFRYRQRTLNNILKRRKIKKYFLINLSGPVYSVLGKILLFFKLGKFISCDGEPFIKKTGINLWMGGTDVKIPNDFKTFHNNCVVMNNFFLGKKNLIQFYPTLIKKVQFSSKFKIVYIAESILDNDKVIDNLWNVQKDKLLKNYSLIDDREFWKDFIHLDLITLQTYYIKLKSRLRYHSIVMLNEKIGERLILVGNNWQTNIKNSIKTNFNKNFIESLYKGNLCLDFGSKWGNLSLYPRSIEIIESGGLLLQSLQSDSKDIFGDNFKNITFNSFENLLEKIEMFDKNPDYLNTYNNNLIKRFENDNLNYNTLDKIWEISKNCD